MSLVISRSSSFLPTALRTTLRTKAPMTLRGRSGANLRTGLRTTLFCKVKNSFRMLSYVALLTTLLFSSQVFSQSSGSPQAVNINVASAEKLAEVLDGVGLAKAKAIVDHRKRYGNFKQIDSIESVKGIGANTLEKNRSKIVLK